MEKYFDVIKNCPLFSAIDKSEFIGILSCLSAKVSVAGKNQTVFVEGNPAKHVGIVLSGAIQIVRDDYYGNRSIVTMAEPSQLFAESFACADIDIMPVSAISVCKSEIMLIDCKKILTICSNACPFHTKLINNMLRVISNKNLLLNEKIEFTSKRTTKEKIIAYLLAQAKKNGKNEFTIPYDRQGLADYLEVERSAMSAEISKLRSQGVIDTKRSWFKIL